MLGFFEAKRPKNHTGRVILAVLVLLLPVGIAQAMPTCALDLEARRYGRSGVRLSVVAMLGCGDVLEVCFKEEIL